MTNFLLMSIKRVLFFILLFINLTNGYAQEETIDTLIYKNLRYDENFSFLRNKQEERQNFPYSFKYIPLNKKETAFLTLGGEVRWQFNNWSNPDWGLQDIQQDNYFLQRYLFHADFKIHKNFRVFGQLKSGLVWGKLAEQIVPDSDQLRVHQLFTDFEYSLSEDFRILLRPGRQEMQYGDSRYVSVREGPNVRLSFDALKMIAYHRNSQYDLFLSRPVTTDPGVLDNRADPNEKFWGFYSMHSAPPLLSGNIDIYYFGLEQLSAEFDQGIAYELRHNFGARFYKTTSRFYYDIELQYQIGKFGDGNINAYTLAGEARYKFQDVRFEPELNFRAGITSGNKNPNNADLQTFNPLYPQGSVFGQIAQIGPTNVIDIQPEVLIHLPNNIIIDFTVEMFWRSSLHDGVYRVPYSLIVPSGNSSARYIGEQYTTEIHWQVTPPLSFHLFTTYFKTGRFLKESGAVKDILFIAPRMTYMF